MILLLIGITLIVSGGIGALAAGFAARSGRFALIGCTAGGFCALTSALRVLRGAPVHDVFLPTLFYGQGLHLSLDPLSAFFIIPIALVSMLSALYGYAYVKPYTQTSNTGLQWLWYALLMASMVLVVSARNVLTFLSAWEIMSLTSFFLVIGNARDKAAASAGWIYCVATHIGTGFLLFLFVWWGRSATSFEFSDLINAVPPHSSGIALLFVCGLIGFGTKAGIVPLHTWLPQAHATAPSHVSAIMSGVMIKMGIYGLIRLIIMLGAPLWWWGGALIALGVITGLLGVLLAASQSDIKRVLAYCSVENIGIICIGLGLGLWGTSHGLPFVALCGFAGGLLHIVNHSLFKSLLFMGAGAVIQQTHERSISKLGGLIKNMPVTAWLFGLGSASICGLPPFNGFISELLIFLAGFSAVLSATGTGLLGLAGAIAALGLIGGLAVVCFTRLFGIAFLGEPRSTINQTISDPSRAMLFAMAGAALGCLGIGLLFFVMVPLLIPVVVQISRLDPTQSQPALQQLAKLAHGLAWGTIALSLLIAVGYCVRLLLLRRRTAQGLVHASVTWDCGYAKPTARMQYTASSFAQPVIDLFTAAIKPVKEYVEPVGYFPVQHGSFNKFITDRILERFMVPLFKRTDRLLARLRWLQAGRVQLYILYIAVTIIILFVWKFGWLR